MTMNSINQQIAADKKKAKPRSHQRMVRPKPYKQNCPKCGGVDIHREYRKPGDDVKQMWGKRDECKDRPPYLESDWPYGWTAKKEHIGHHCRTCGWEWESPTLA